MSVVLIIVVLMLFISTGELINNKMLKGKSAVKALPSKKEVDPTADLSPQSKAIYNEYMELPLESRPFDNIKDILLALDATMRFNPDFTNHFDDNYWMRHQGYSDSFRKMDFSWTARSVRDKRGLSSYLQVCDHKNCEFSTYHDMHLEIQGVKKALDNKARALVVSDNAHNVSMADELIEALRIEAGIQKSATESIKEKI